MSWDTTERITKCPCGKGKIVQCIKEDDWNQVREETPYIDCPECSQKFKIESESFSSCKPERGTWTYYYLVLKDLKPEREDLDNYPHVYDYELARKDFSEYLIFDYSKKDLEAAYMELKDSSSIASLNDVAKEIAKEKKRYTKSCKTKELLILVEKAIAHYDAYHGNYEQREEERKENEKIHKEYYDEVRKKGILIKFNH